MLDAARTAFEKFLLRHENAICYYSECLVNNLFVYKLTLVAGDELLIIRTPTNFHLEFTAVNTITSYIDNYYPMRDLGWGLACVMKVQKLQISYREPAQPTWGRR